MASASLSQILYLSLLLFAGRWNSFHCRWQGSARRTRSLPLVVDAFVPVVGSQTRTCADTTICRVALSSNVESSQSDVQDSSLGRLFSPNDEFEDLEDDLFEFDFGLDDDDENDKLAEDEPPSDKVTTAEDEVAQFVRRMKESATGSLDADVVVLMRETTEELIAMGADDPVGPVDQDNDKLTALQLATDLWERFVQEYRSVALAMNQDDAVAVPTTEDFNRLYAAWQRALGGEKRNQVSTHILPIATQRVQQLLELQQAPYLDGIASPNTHSYELVLQILSQSRHCSKPAWQIFSSLEEKTIPLYEAAITSTAKSRHAHACSRAQNLLLESIQLGKVSVQTCNHVLTAWAKSGLPYGPQRAEEIIRWMETDAGISPNAQSFTSLLDAYAQQGTWEAAVQCERILQSLVDLYIQDNDLTLEPTVATWTIPLQAWSRLAKKNWNKAAGRAARTFRKWEALYEEGKVQEGPDGLAYQMVMQVYVRSDASKAESWLDKQYEVYRQSGDERLRPTARSVRNVVESWTRQRDDPGAMEEAEFVWERYQEIVGGDAGDDIVADLYRTLLFGYCQREESERAVEILQEMVNRQLHPDCFCYDRVLEATTRQMSVASADGTEEDDVDPALVDRAHAVFSLMEKQREAGHVKPNERVYTSFIRALTKARAPKLARKARLLLQRMRDLSLADDNVGIRPTVFTYNAVLLAAATGNDPGAFGVALQTFNELRKDRSVQMDHVSIGNMLRCSKLVEEEKKRSDLIRSIFQLGRNKELVNDFVLRDLRLVATPEQCEELLGEDSEGIEGGRI